MQQWSTHCWSAPGDHRILLLLFVSIDWDCGFWTATVVHMTFSAARVAVVVHLRLLTFDAVFEEAVRHKSRRDPVEKRSSSFTLPVISPVSLFGWLLAFTLSPTIRSRRRGATALPMRLYGWMSRRYLRIRRYTDGTDRSRHGGHDHRLAGAKAAHRGGATRAVITHNAHTPALPNRSRCCVL